MTFLRPDILVPITGLITATASVTDAEVAYVPFDCKVFYITVICPDTDATFTTVDIILEWDDNSTGNDTVIDTITVAANDRMTVVDLDGLTSTAVIPAGSRILSTIATWTTPSTAPVQVTLWVWPMSRA